MLLPLARKDARFHCHLSSFARRFSHVSAKLFQSLRDCALAVAEPFGAEAVRPGARAIGLPYTPPCPALPALMVPPLTGSEPCGHRSPLDNFVDGLFTQTDRATNLHVRDSSGPNPEPDRGGLQPETGTGFRNRQ